MLTNRTYLSGHRCYPWTGEAFRFYHFKHLCQTVQCCFIKSTCIQGIISTLGPRAERWSNLALEVQIIDGSPHNWGVIM